MVAFSPPDPLPPTALLPPLPVAPPDGAPAPPPDLPPIPDLPPTAAPPRFAAPPVLTAPPVPAEVEPPKLEEPPKLAPPTLVPPVARTPPVLPGAPPVTVTPPVLAPPADDELPPLAVFASESFEHAAALRIANTLTPQIVRCMLASDCRPGSKPRGRNRPPRTTQKFREAGSPRRGDVFAPSLRTSRKGRNKCPGQATGRRLGEHSWQWGDHFKSVDR
jgi:hypothetical protein